MSQVAELICTMELERFFGELVHDGSHHLQMGQFFGDDVGIEIVHLKVT